MPPIWLILTFVAIVLYDVNTHTPTFSNLTTLESSILTLGPILVITLISAARVLQLGAAIFRGKPDAPRKAMRAERWSSIARNAPAAWLIASIYLFGWLDAVRNITSDRIAIDELIAASPVVFAALASWAAYHPINRRLREIALTGALFTGKPAPPLPTLTEYITDQFRNRIALGLIILTALLTWRESTDLLLSNLTQSSEIAAESQHISSTLELSQAALQLIGVAFIMLLAPLAARLAWNTRPLPQGELRDNLAGMCAQHNVKVRNILVWRTHGSTLNAAVMGLIPQLRYVLLTDALIDELSQERLEAVMAHELGHVSCKHMPWLIASLIAAITTATLAFTIPAEWAIYLANLPENTANAATITTTALGLATGFLAFGYVSRRFEWQADAFGAKHGSTPTAAAMQQQQSTNPPPWIWSTTNIDDETKNPSGSRDHHEANATQRRTTAQAPTYQQPQDNQSDSERAATVRERSEQPTAPPYPPSTPTHITQQGAIAMAGALADVARYNHAEIHRFGFLHGSIHTRQTRLKALTGKPTNNLPIDRTVRRIKRAVAIALVAVLALTAWDIHRTVNHNNRVREQQQLNEARRQEAINQLRSTAEAAFTGFTDAFRKPPITPQSTQPAPQPQLPIKAQTP